MKKDQLISIITECYQELLSEIISNPKDFKITIEDSKFIEKNGKKYFTEWTGYGKIKIPFGEWITINRGTRKAKFRMPMKGIARDIDISKYLEKQTINETLDSIVYSNEIVSSGASIDELIKNYSGHYSEFVRRGSAKFFNLDENTFKFSFNLVFPRKKVEFNSGKDILKNVSDELDFYNPGNDKNKVYGKGITKLVSEDDKNFILNFTVRGGK